MKKIILLCVPLFLFAVVLPAQTIVYFPKFSAFGGEGDRKKAIVKATILLQKSIDYLYANEGGEIRFLGDSYELGYFSEIAKGNWREMNSTTESAFQDLQNAIKSNQTSLITSYLNKPKSFVYQSLFANSELKNSVLGEKLHLYKNYTQSVLADIKDYSNLTAQRFATTYRNIEIQPPTTFSAPKKIETPYIKFVPDVSNKAKQVRFIAPRMPDITEIIPTEYQAVFDYINDHYLSLAKINRPTTASKLLYALDRFTKTTSEDILSARAMRNLIFPTKQTTQTVDLWKTIEQWNGCRALFDAFDLFTTLQTYASKYDAPSLNFTSCIFDGNLVNAWEENDNYQFEQSSLIYVGANRNRLGRIVVDFNACTWLDILGDGVHFHNCVKSKIDNCNAGNVGRGAITATGQNADIRIDAYTDITYDASYSKLSTIPKPDEIGKVLVEVDSDATRDDVFFKLTNSSLYSAKIVDERARKYMDQKGGYYELTDNEIRYSFTQSVPKSKVVIKDCSFGSSTKSFSGKNGSSNIRFNYAASALISNCTFESTLHKINYGSHHSNLGVLDFFVTVNIQDTAQSWKNQTIEFINCDFKNANTELYRAIMIDGKNAVDDIANNNRVIFKNISVEGNFHTGIQIGGGTVELNNLRAMKLTRSGVDRAYFLRRSASNSRLIIRYTDFLDASKFQFYYYYSASDVGKEEDTFEWEHYKVVLPQRLNLIESSQCSKMGYIKFIGERFIIGDQPSPNTVQTMGFYKDQYKGTTGCTWITEETGCVSRGSYNINWIKHRNCSDAK